ncbi:MAG TPA: TonB-dependent receptor plug domain-containing protein, partial [Chitinophagaceae bacterium]
MKLTAFCMLLFCMQVSAKVYSQETVTLSLKRVEIVKALHILERKSDYRFLYKDALIPANKRVDVEVRNAKVPDIVTAILANTGLTYRVLGANLIVIARKNTAIEASPFKGKVTDKITGQPLVGVTVKVKNMNEGTVTDAGGNFSLDVPDSVTLLVSYIGYETEEVAVNGRREITIALNPSATGLNEVVVVGYGTQTKKDITGAVSVVSSKDMANRPIVNVAEALQGKAAGVQVISNSGKPGAGLTIRVRGSSSISAGNDPLYVVDGIPMTDISSYSPDDIESISILKDAASAAIYGTRAANGVVVITTKKGTVGKSRIDFGVYYGTSSPTKKLSVLDAKQYQQY